MSYLPKASVDFACRIGVNVGRAEPQARPSLSLAQSTRGILGAADLSADERGVAMGGRSE
ncbi:hypothetical protein BLJAPNOD_05073 [Ensifer sp. M14]|uniref:hypothetical protein n=1 Tax=Ensifer sp. M14 TaxID=2203782 RepID=UPI000E1D93AA|nr:hypothetical protein [Ensifer sp. M14]RDL48795.1 hypothetical protein BLJAPNOD_05073 [Ensifer sp. M14]